jgi:hypothetical protein
LTGISFYFARAKLAGIIYMNKTMLNLMLIYESRDLEAPKNASWILAGSLEVT